MISGTNVTQPRYLPHTLLQIMINYIGCLIAQHYTKRILRCVYNDDDYT